MTDRRTPFALCAGYFLVLLDVTVVNVALPSLGTSLHTSASGLAWIVDAYTTPLAALLPASGAIGERLGHRRVVIAGFTAFGVASVLCAVAPSIFVLILGRGVQGIAAALMLPGTLALLTESAADERARTRTVARWAAVGGAALPAGPLLGGLLVQQLGWRSVFWVNVPVIAAALIPIAAARFLPRPVTSRRVDWLGAGLLALLIGSVVTLISAPSAVVALLAVAAAVGLVHAERRSPDPLVRVEPSARRPLVRACVVAGLMNLCTLGVLFVLTQLFQDVRGLSPWTAGLLLLPAMLPLPLLGPVAGRIVTAIGVWRTASAALAVGAAGFALLACSVTGDDSAVLFAGLVLWGSGLGVLTPAVVTAALRSAPRSAGTASGASNASRQLGGTIGVAAAGAIAGVPDSARFVPHATIVLIGAAVCFAVTAALVYR
ncbi:MFS transporter [Amycolatopsis lurida]